MRALIGPCETASKTINVGQTAATFKARIGCENAPRYVFAKGLGPVISRLVYYGSRLLLIQMRADGPLHIFREEIPVDAANMAKCAGSRASQSIIYRCLASRSTRMSRW